MEPLEHLLTRLNQIRDEYGEEAWLEAIRKVAKDCIRAGGQAAVFGKAALDGVHPSIKWDELVAEVKTEDEAAARVLRAEKAASDEQVFMRALQGQLPGLKSQGQFTAFQASFEAFRAVVNGILEGKKDQEKVGREALDKALETLRMATEITRKLEDVPEAATSEAAAEFKKPPSAFTEYDKQRALLSELQQVGTLSALDDWWRQNRQRIDEVKTPSLRNPLIDAVREKKHQLEKGPQA